MRLALIENLAQAEGYCHQKGIFPAREAVVMDTQARGIRGVGVEDVFMGNGVSELILMAMEALLERGDEVLVPAPDYPLWTAAVTLTGARPVHYPCRPENGFVPDPAEVEALVGPRTRALVLINPNKPHRRVRGAVEAWSASPSASLVLFSDEIYDRILYDGEQHVSAATLCEGTLCATFGGLSRCTGPAASVSAGCSSAAASRTWPTTSKDRAARLPPPLLQRPGPVGVQAALGGSTASST